MPAHRRHAARTRRVSAAGLAPTSGEIVTQIQLGGSRPDSVVRVRYAQPASPVSGGDVRAPLRHMGMGSALILEVARGGLAVPCSAVMVLMAKARFAREVNSQMKMRDLLTIPRVIPRLRARDKPRCSSKACSARCGRCRGISGSHCPLTAGVCRTASHRLGGRRIPRPHFCTGTWRSDRDLRKVGACARLRGVRWL
jgi:hypothetical protein